MGLRRVAAGAIAVALLSAVTMRGVLAEPTSAAVIQPGGAVCPAGGPLDDGSCAQWSTLNFVFADRQGRLYIGASAHNFAGVGDRALVRGDGDAFGTVVFDDDSVDFLHPGDPPNPTGTDFALIRIDRNRYGDVDPGLAHFGGPTGVADPVTTATGDVVVAFGQGRPDLTTPTGPRSGMLLADNGRAFSSTVPESGGDSGMPYLHAATGTALGVNAICVCGGPGLYPTVAHLLERLASNGFNLRLVLDEPRWRRAAARAT